MVPLEVDDYESFDKIRMQADSKGGGYYRHWKEFPIFRQIDGLDNCMIESDRDFIVPISENCYEMKHISKVVEKDAGRNAFSALISILSDKDIPGSEPRQTKIQKYNRYREKFHAKIALESSIKELLATETNYLSDLKVINSEFVKLFSTEVKLKGYSLSKIERNGIKRFVKSFYKIFDFHRLFLGDDVHLHGLQQDDASCERPITVVSRISIIERLLLLLKLKKNSISASKKPAKSTNVDQDNSASSISKTTPRSDDALVSLHKLKYNGNIQMMSRGIIDRFENNIHRFQLYEDYCAFYSMFVGVYHQYFHVHSKFINDRKKSSMLDYLIRPIQRLCQYSLLLGQLSKYSVYLENSDEMKRIENIVKDISTCITGIEQMRLNQERIEKTSVLEAKLRKSFVKHDNIMKLSSMVMFKKAKRKLTNTELPLCMAVLFDSYILVVRSRESCNEESASSAKSNSSFHKVCSSSLELIKKINLETYITTTDRTSSNACKIVLTKPERKQYWMEFLLESEFLQWEKALDIKDEFALQGNHGAGMCSRKKTKSLP